MIDAICNTIYGDESGFVEMLLEANPGLAALSDPLPIGTVIMLPPEQIIKTREVVSLWD